MSEAEEKRRARLEALNRYTEENDFGGTFRGGYISPFGRNIGSSEHGTFTRSDIERYKLNEGSIGFDDDFAFDRRPEPRQPSPEKTPEPTAAPAVPEPEDIPVPEEAEMPEPDIQPLPEQPARTADERAAAELHEAWNTAPHATSEIIVNRSRECFSILRARNSSGRAGYEEISRGMIDIAEVLTIVGYDGVGREYLNARFRRDHTTVEGLINKRELEKSPEKLFDIASENGVQFFTRKNAGIAAKYLLDMSASSEEHIIQYLSFYRDEDGTVHHPDEAAIFRNAAPAAKVKELFTDSGSFRTVFLLCYRLLTELEASGYMQEFPVLIFTAHDSTAALGDIAEILGEPDIYKIDKHYKDADNKRVRLFNAANCTKYNIGRYMPEIMSSADVRPTIFAAGAAKQLGDGEMLRSAVVLPYTRNESEVSDIRGIYDHIRTVFIKHGITPEDWQRTVEGVDVSEFNVYSSYLAAQLLVTVWIILSELTDRESAEEYVGRLRKWFVTVTEDADEHMTERLKGFLRSGSEGVSLNRSGNANVIAESLNEYARRDMWRTDFAAVFASRGIISRSELSLQRSATVNGRSYRVYEIVQDKLFPYGELRTVVNEFAAGAPEIMIPFAQCCGQQICLAFGTLSGSECANILISGEDLSLRYSVCGSIINGVRGLGGQVIAADISDAEDSEDNGISYLHFAGAEAANTFLTELLMRKKENSAPLTLLIIGSSENWDMSARSPLVGKIMKNGGKYGIICCITAKSADIDGSFAVNIHAGEFGFRPGERRVFGIPAGECPQKQAVLDMPADSLLAAGSLATEKGYVRDPVIINL